LAQPAAASRSQPQLPAWTRYRFTTIRTTRHTTTTSPLPALLLRDLTSTHRPKKRKINQRPLPTLPRASRAARALGKTIDLMTTTLYLYILLALAVVYDQFTKRILSRLRDAERPTSAFGLVRANKPSSHVEHVTDEPVHDEHARAHGFEQVYMCQKS
jgi:hypothetical protein